MTIGGAEVALALAAVTEETTIIKGANRVGGEEKEVMMRKTAMVTIVVVTDTAIENISEAAERGANHRGTIDHLIVIGNVRKRRKDAEIIHLPATIAAVIAVLIAIAAAHPPLQGAVPNAVKKHARNHPKSHPLTNNPPNTILCK